MARTHTADHTSCRPCLRVHKSATWAGCSPSLTQLPFRFLANSRPSACAPPHLRLMRVSLVLHETHPAHVRSPRASYLSYGGRHPPFSGLPGSLSCSLDARMRAASCYHFQPVCLAHSTPCIARTRPNCQSARDGVVTRFSWGRRRGKLLADLTARLRDEVL